MSTSRVVLDMSGEAYHASAGLSHSDSKRLRKSPLHYAALRTPGAPPKAPTAQMFAGTLAHCALLEPEQFDLRYVVAPDISKNSNAYKEFAAKCIERGLEAISAEQRERAFAQAASLLKLDDVAQMMGSGESEVSAWWTDKATGVLCKCRPDRVYTAKHGVLLLDLKTTTDASPDAFSKSVATFGYHTQADWYSQGYAQASGTEVLGFVFAVVEAEFPYACATYMLDADALARGRAENVEARRRFKACCEQGAWPGYPSGLEISLPRWYRGGLNDDIEGAAA